MTKTEKINLHKTESAAEHYAHMKYKICVSGAAETKHCGEAALEMAYEMGKEIVARDGILLTGATTGVPFWAAKGAKDQGGISVGLSPAATEKAHVNTYKLPVDYFDFIIYTGFEYAGRNLLLTRSADAVIIICGRIGTLNEFTVAFEDGKPVGVLEGSGGAADMIREIIAKSHRGPGKVVFDSDPKLLLSKVLELINKEKAILVKNHNPEPFGSAEDFGRE